jgi:hypothetical protein
VKKDYPRPTPPIPAKFRTVAEFGKAIGWGTYDAAARERARTITRKEVIEDLEITVEIARGWLDRYLDEVAREIPAPERARADRPDETYNRVAGGVMAKSKRYPVTRITNKGDKPMIFVLEPWGEVYGMPPGAAFDVLSDGPPDQALEMEAGGNTVTVYGWVGSSLWVNHNGRRPRIAIHDQEEADRFLQSGRTKARKQVKRRLAATAGSAAS